MYFQTFLLLLNVAENYLKVFGNSPTQNLNENEKTMLKSFNVFLANFYNNFFEKIFYYFKIMFDEQPSRVFNVKKKHLEKKIFVYVN